jgi:hypothetical protein
MSEWQKVKLDKCLNMMSGGTPSQDCHDRSLWERS